MSKVNFVIQINNRSVVYGYPGQTKSLKAQVGVAKGKVIYMGDNVVSPKINNSIKFYTPLINSSISSLKAFDYFLKYIVSKNQAPNYSLIINSSFTDLEKRAVIKLAKKYGIDFDSTLMLMQNFISEYGVIEPKQAYCLINWSIDVCEIFFINSNVLINSIFIKDFYSKIINQVNSLLDTKYDLLADMWQIENAVTSLLTAPGSKNSEGVITISGINTKTKVPVNFALESSMINLIIQEQFYLLGEQIKDAFLALPTSQIASLIQNGIILFGELANTPGIEDFLSRVTNLPTYKVPNSQVAIFEEAGKNKKEQSRITSGLFQKDS